MHKCAIRRGGALRPALALTAARELARVRTRAGVSPHKLEERQKEDYGNHHVSSAYGDNGTVLVWREGGVSVSVVSVADHTAYVAAVCRSVGYTAQGVTPSSPHIVPWCATHAGGSSTCLQAWVCRNCRSHHPPHGWCTT